MTRRLVTVTAFAAFVLASPLARAEEMQPGQYVSINVIELANGQKRTHEARECLTAKDIADGLTKVGVERDNDCKARDLVKGKGKITYRLVCEEDGTKWSAEVVGTYTAGSYEFVLKAASPGPGIRSIKASGKRLGACR